ncbi:MAG: hypothetical protein H7A55_13930 [Verrucomicrobiaceae bacterium]|nr:hypothetical protein [Verrucomicrobiaceae bacterium]
MRRYALPQILLAVWTSVWWIVVVINSIVAMREKNTSIFGLVLWSGFPQAFVSLRSCPAAAWHLRWTLGKSSSSWWTALLPSPSVPFAW